MFSNKILLKISKISIKIYLIKTHNHFHNPFRFLNFLLQMKKILPIQTRYQYLQNFRKNFSMYLPYNYHNLFHNFLNLTKDIKQYGDKLVEVSNINDDEQQNKDYKLLAHSQEVEHQLLYYYYYHRHLNQLTRTARNSARLSSTLFNLLLHMNDVRIMIINLIKSIYSP